MKLEDDYRGVRCRLNKNNSRNVLKDGYSVRLKNW